ncbi:MAG: tRNA (adenosine(37)-N6)-threonylcarbamoyltransferase complex dimerization subunit type 1 TsaB [Thermoguttaceae bacterium]
MNILALETTDSVGSVAAMTDGKLLLELGLNPQQRTAQSLPPGIATLLEGVGWKPADVHLVALTIGPGSFTGLRVGVTLAKTFAYSVGAEVLGVNTLETIAEAAPTNVSAVTAVVDAQRGDVVVRSFIRGPEGWLLPAGNQQLISIDRWLQELPAGMAVTGPILGKLAPRLPSHATMLDQQYWTPRAAMVAQLAHCQYAAGRRDDLWTLVPQYSRQSAAEEKWQTKGEGGRGKGEG